MKKTLPLMALAALVLLPAMSMAAPLGTAFTYQGRLDQNGAPALNGDYQINASLFAQASPPGAALASNPGLLAHVTNGLFTVDLDFGAAAFTGEARWLELAVRTNNSALPVNVLSPRTRLAPTPNALYASTAGAAASIAGGTAVTSLNGLRDSVNLVAGANVTLTPSGNSLTINSSGSGAFSLNGNNAYYNAGNVGIGTTTPSTYGHGGTARILEINNSGTALNSQSHLILFSGVNSPLDSSIGTVTWAQPGGMAAYIGALTRSTTPNSPAAMLTFGTRNVGDSAAFPKMVITEDGRIGMGTAGPSGKLTIATSDDTTPGTVFAFDSRHALVGTPAAGLSLSYSGSAGAGYISALAPGVAWKDLVLQASTLRFNASGASTAFSVLNNGNVGIGTDNPFHKLDVVGGGNFRTGLSTGGDLVMAGAETEAALGTFRIYGRAPVQFPAPTRFIVAKNGNTGIGTSAPEQKLHVDGGYALVEGLAGEKAYIGGDGSGDVEVGSFNPGVTAVSLWNPRRNGGEFLHLNMKSCTITGGADLAEPFPMKEEQIDKGSVVIIDEEHPGRLKLSTRAYDTQVAGIVSGANGIHPGIALKQEGALDQGQNVALTGRVYVKADASHGAIKPGDLLTTSDTPGHAMKVSEHAKAQGAILGKAMGTLKEGTGLVLVLVTLQ